MAFNRFLAAVALAALMPAAATAQTGFGAITGVVKDESDGAVPGAAIKVVNEGTGAAVDVFSNEQGSYEVTGLVPGQYRLVAALDGFETVARAVDLELLAPQDALNHDVDRIIVVDDQNSPCWLLLILFGHHAAGFFSKPSA